MSESSVGSPVVAAPDRRLLAFLYIGLQVACALIVLYASYRVSARMAFEQRTASDIGDAIEFFEIAAPTFLLAMVINLAWLAKAILDVSRRDDHRAIRFLGGAVALWIVTIVALRFV